MSSKSILRSSVVITLGLVAIAALATVSSLSTMGCNVASSVAEPPPTCPEGLRSQCVSDVAVGAGFGCARFADRSVWCWGRNDQGQLGYATSDLCPDDVGGGKTRSVACHTFPFRVVGLEGATAVSAGEAFSCAILVDGGVRCWGSNIHGELGNGSNLTSQAPVTTSSLSNVEALALGSRHACALHGGKVSCWGANDHGQLGVTTSTTCGTGSGGGSGATGMACAMQPVEVPGLDHVVEVTAGDGHTCARIDDGSVVCFGHNDYGQLGLGHADAPLWGMRRPVLVGLDEPLGAVLSISAAGDATCALVDGGRVHCWGRDDHRELGAPPPASGLVSCTGPCSTLAVEVSGLPSVLPTIGDEDGGPTKHDAGDDAPEGADATSATDAKTSADTGAGGGGGDGGDDTKVTTKSDSGADTHADGNGSTGTDTGTSGTSTPLGNFGRALAAGGGFSCLRIGDGTVRCWGADGVDQLGDGLTTSESRGPAMVIASPGAAPTNPLQGVVRVRAGLSSACAVMSDSSLRCWGSNQMGALGVGHFSPQLGPVPVSW